jgi:chromosome partitioning protein
VILSVISLKGGVGKTTTALHLGTVAALEGNSVTLLDADAESSALSWADFARENGTPLPFEVKRGDENKLSKQARDIDSTGRTVIIDTPPNNREMLAFAGMVADFIIIPVSATGLDVDRLRNTLDALSNVEASRGTLTYGILLTRFDTRKKLAHESFTTLEGGYNVFDQRIRDLSDYEKSFGVVPYYLEEYRAVWSDVKGVLDGGR